MQKEFLMGNAAIALGAIAAGVNVVAGYPGTPSTEVLETVAAHRPEQVYVEWSVNEKAAMELAAGASYTGANTLVTMKQVGLNVASDPLMSLAYLGIEGGMVVMVADDPGPISSQTEQDTRQFSIFSKLPCFDPSSVQEAYEMIQEAFATSRKYKTPVFFRPTTRICHAYSSVEVKDPSEYLTNEPSGFVKDSSRWVIFPRLSLANHKKIEERNEQLTAVFSEYRRNAFTEGASGLRIGVAAGGIGYAYAMEALATLPEEKRPSVLKVATPFPFPEELAVKFLESVDRVLVVEELDPVIERALLLITGKYHLKTEILGKMTHTLPYAGEYTADLVKTAMEGFVGAAATGEASGNAASAGASASVGTSASAGTSAAPEALALPVRPPVLCAGCPHRASFYAVKQAMKGKKTIFCGDIGCYTLGNAEPLDMCDTCLCMGAGISIAQGVWHVEPDTYCFAFVGDSTFFASAITEIVNAVYNQASLTVVILDNSTTAMTGHQPHPGTGKTMMGEVVAKVSIEGILKGIGLEFVETVDPLDQELSVDVIKRASEAPGVKAVIFKSPCVAIVKSGEPCNIDAERCIGCKKCIREIGCPAIYTEGKEVMIDRSLCTGCGLCTGLCPVQAISHGKGGAAL